MTGHSQKTLPLHESEHPSAEQGAKQVLANFSPWWEAAQPYVDLVKTAIQS